MQVAQAADDFPPNKSLYIISSKSGSTAEVSALLEYFWQLSEEDGRRFVAITDPGTPLAKLAEERGFRKVFLANQNVGGRYSALTAFGLVPGALLSLDLERLLSTAKWMMAQCRSDFPAARNPGVALGAVLAESALHGRDKLTIVSDASLAPFGSWLEQLIAESSGKMGKGILPVDRERLGDVDRYGADRLFVYLRQTGQLDSKMADLRSAGHPVLEISVPQVYDLGADRRIQENRSVKTIRICFIRAGQSGSA
jgi:transaldolase/glucose-6-phosphate isomerase